MTRHVQITQNHKFNISLENVNKEVSDEVDFLLAYKHESFIQIDTMDFDEDGQGFAKFPKRKVYNFFTISHKRSYR